MVAGTEPLTAAPVLSVRPLPIVDSLFTVAAAVLPSSLEPRKQISKSGPPYFTQHHGGYWELGTGESQIKLVLDGSFRGRTAGQHENLQHEPMSD